MLANNGVPEYLVTEYRTMLKTGFEYAEPAAPESFATTAVTDATCRAQRRAQRRALGFCDFKCRSFLAQSFWVPAVRNVLIQQPKFENTTTTL